MDMVQGLKWHCTDCVPKIWLDGRNSLYSPGLWMSFKRITWRVLTWFLMQSGNNEQNKLDEQVIKQGITDQDSRPILWKPFYWRTLFWQKGIQFVKWPIHQVVLALPSSPSGFYWLLTKCTIISVVVEGFNRLYKYFPPRDVVFQ